jgi:excisionase family DNA binding protein
MGRSLSQPDRISDLIDAYYDAKVMMANAERNLAKEIATTWLASRSDQGKTSGPIGPEVRPDDGLMTLQETAKFLNVTDQTVHAWRKRGIIEGLQFGEEWRFQRDELIRAGRKTQASKKPLRMVS